MELTNVINALTNQRKGTFVKIGWTSEIGNAKARKDGVSITKQTDAITRWGISYENLKSVKELKAQRSAEGNPVKETTPWFVHLKETPFIIQHVKDKAKTYVQLYPIKNRHLIKTKYFINDKETTKQAILDAGWVNASEFNKSETLIMNIPTANIRYIGK